VNSIPDLEHWWNSSLDGILNQFVNVFENKIDQSFWSKIYKIEGASGGPYVTGWAIAFFPYLRKGTKNVYVWEKNWLDAYDTANIFSGLNTSDFPFTLNKVPFVWNCFNNEYNMTLVGGLFGVDYNATDKSLTPLFGYAVCQE